MTDETNLKQISNVTRLPTRSMSSTQLSMRPSAEQMDEGRKAAKRILASFVDYGKAPPEYVIAFAEYLAHLTTAERELVLHPRLGIRGQCKFLPTIAECESLLRADAERKRQFASPTSWHRLGPERDPQGYEADPAKRRAVVARLLNERDAGA